MSAEGAAASWRGYLELPRAVHILCVGSFVNRAGTMMMPYMALYLSQGLGFPREMATAFLGAAGVGSMVASTIGGAMADHLGRKPVMLFALFGGALMILLLSTLTSPAAVLAGIFGFMMVSDTYRPASQAMVSDLVEEAHRQRAYALLYVAHNLGFAAGISLGGVLAAHSFQYLFWGDAASAVIFGILIALTIRETMGHAQRSERAPVSTWAATKIILKDKVFMVFALSHTLVGVVFSQCGSTLPLYVTDQGLGPSEYGQIMALNGIMVVTLQLPVTHWVERRSRGLVLAAGSILVALGMGLTGLASGLIALALTVAVWTLGEVLLASSGQVVVAALAPEAIRARYFGAFSLSMNAAMVIAPGVGGFVLSHYGGQVLWTGSAALGLLSAMGMLLVRRGLDRGREA